MTSTFNLLGAMAMPYPHAKVQGQRSVGFEDRVETSGWTDGRTEAIALPPTLMRLVNVSVFKLQNAYCSLMKLLGIRMHGTVSY